MTLASSFGRNTTTTPPMRYGFRVYGMAELRYAPITTKAGTKGLDLEESPYVERLSSIRERASRSARTQPCASVDCWAWMSTVKSVLRGAKTKPIVFTPPPTQRPKTGWAGIYVREGTVACLTFCRLEDGWDSATGMPAGYPWLEVRSPQEVTNHRAAE